MNAKEQLLKTRYPRLRAFVLDLIEQLKERELSDVMHEDICTLQDFIASDFKGYEREDINTVIHNVVDTANKLMTICNWLEEFAIKQDSWYEAEDFFYHCAPPGECEFPNSTTESPYVDYHIDTWKFCAKHFFHLLWKYKRFFKKKLDDYSDGFAETTEHLKITDAQIDKLFVYNCWSHGYR